MACTKDDVTWHDRPAPTLQKPTGRIYWATCVCGWRGHDTRDMTERTYETKFHLEGRL